MANEIIQTTFDYGVFDQDTATFLQETEDKIIGRTQRLMSETGKDLLCVKERIGHGHFVNWVRARFGISEDTAQRFMSVALRFGEIPHGAVFEDRALYLLSRKSTSEDARQEAKERGIDGEEITLEVAKEIIESEKRRAESAEQEVEALKSQPRPEPAIREVLPPEVAEKLAELEEELRQEKGKTRRSAEDKRQSNDKINRLSDEIKHIKEEYAKVSDAFRKQEGLTREQIYKIQRQETWKQRADVFCSDANQFVHDVPYPDWAAEFFGPDELIRVNRVMKAIESIRAKLDQLISPQGGIVDAEAPAQDTEETSVLLVS